MCLKVMIMLVLILNGNICVYLNLKVVIKYIRIFGCEKIASFIFLTDPEGNLNFSVRLLFQSNLKR